VLSLAEAWGKLSTLSRVSFIFQEMASHSGVLSEHGAGTCLEEVDITGYEIPEAAQESIIRSHESGALPSLKVRFSRLSQCCASNRVHGAHLHHFCQHLKISNELVAGGKTAVDRLQGVMEGHLQVVGSSRKRRSPWDSTVS
jgi:hypothetical protein